MTGPEHYKAAERLLRAAEDGAMDETMLDQDEYLFAAQVHATLAHAAATALKDPEQAGFYSVDRIEWETAASLRKPDVSG